MDVFLLGAGRPAEGGKPSALKKIALNTNAMDWQIHSFDVFTDASRLHFLGGYHVDEIIEGYPNLNITVVPDWESHSVLHTVMHAPFSRDAAILTYADTVFRPSVIGEVVRSSADVVFAVDSTWKARFSNRSEEDIAAAETLDLAAFCDSQGDVEFTGLIHLSEKVVAFLATHDWKGIGSNLLDLLRFLKSEGFSLQSYDVAGNWAEFNSPEDIAHFILGTKAETLARLEPLVQKSYIGRQVSFTSELWERKPENILAQVLDKFSGSPLVVRSSAFGEDNWDSSNAGGFDSLLNIDGANKKAITDAINHVMASYGNNRAHGDQILVQKFLQGVKMSGVIFTCGLETGAPYYRFNFDDMSQSTESVTSGTQNDLRTVLVSRYQTESIRGVAPELVSVLEAVQELESLLGFDRLDIEFAVDNDGQVHIFQVRPMTVDHSSFDVDDEKISASLNADCRAFENFNRAKPFVFGDRVIFGNMPDWNPAEIIGIRPKPLAFSLYRQLITNEVWASQRDEFGYRCVKPSPLLYAFSGQPYIDVRASFNSFIPESIPDALAEKLVTAYLNILADNPHYHDKVEFDVLFTVWMPDFESLAIDRLVPYGITEQEISVLGSALKNITKKAFARLSLDISSIDKMKERQKKISEMDMPSLEKAFALLDDCRRYGTLAFSHAARAGFVASTLLKSFVKKHFLSEERRREFMLSIQTVAGEFEFDKYKCASEALSKDTLVKRYGHLRPGTYEIQTQAYWEDPDRYLDCSSSENPESHLSFHLSSKEEADVASFLNELNSSISPEQLFDYFRAAIQQRELVKFKFTRNLSFALDCILRFGEEVGISRNDLSFMEYGDIEKIRINAMSLSRLKKLINSRKRGYVVTELVELPPLLINVSDFYGFERGASQPNFITTKAIDARAVLLGSNETSADLSGAIVLIPQADPGFDWLFGQDIAGLITQYGGANSHMAIRAAEIDLPAAIGVGENLYEKISKAKLLRLDCANQLIKGLE